MTISRRAFLRASALSTAGVVAGPTWALAQDGQVTPPGEDWVRVYLIVVDGLRPDEVVQMPTLTQLATDGRYYPHSRAQMLAETTPNHVSMITGMRADRHGMPGNEVPFLADDVGLEPRYLQADTLYSTIARQSPDLVAVAATSKSYIVAMSKHMRVDADREDADATNDPFIVPVSGAAVDAEVGADALRQSRELDPDFAWMSLGDVDRTGHVDQSGATGGPPAFRSASLQTADQQVGNLIAELQESGRWDNTVLLVTADHSMDWSTPDSIVSLMPQFDAAPDLAGQVTFAENGGGAFYGLLAPDVPGADLLRKAMRDIAIADPGVDEAWYTRPNLADGGTAHWVGESRPDWALAGDRTGDLIMVVRKGFRVTEPSPQSNAVPGNHAHIVTLPIPQIVAGGWDGIVPNDAIPGGPVGEDAPADDERDPAFGENIDIAPTVAYLLNLNPPPGGYDGVVLPGAFTRQPQPRHPVADVPSLPRYEEIAGSSRFATAVALSQAAFPVAADAEGNPLVDTIVVASGLAFPDALAATPLAVRRGGPLLLCLPTSLPEVVAEEVRRLRPTTAFVVGGQSAVNQAVLTELFALGVQTVRRLAGGSRYGTAAAIAREAAGLTGAGEEPSGVGRGEPPPVGPDVILASGESFPDALAAGPLAGHTGRLILLTAKDTLPEETATALAQINPARVLLAGGTAVISAVVQARLAEHRQVERLGGENRFATAALLVERTIREGGLADRAFIVTADDFADALAAGPAVSRLGGMLLPLGPAGVAASGAVGELLSRRADGLVLVSYVGGPAVVRPSVRNEVELAILARRTRSR